MDLTTISTATAALVLRPDAAAEASLLDSSAPEELRRLVTSALPEVAGWLDGSTSIDAEQIHCLVDLIRVRAQRDVVFRAEAVTWSRAAGGAPAEALRRLGADCGREGYWDTGAWCCRTGEALFRARGDAGGAARCRADLEALWALRDRAVVDYSAGDEPLVDEPPVTAVIG